MLGGAINACLPPIRVPNEVWLGTLMGGRHTINSELGVLCCFYCGNPKMSRCDPSRETPLALRKAAIP